MKTPSPEEIQAFSGPGTLSRYLRTVSQCAKLKEKIEETKQTVRTTSHNSRVQSTSINGYDFVFEYPNDTEKKPSAIVGMGRRIDLEAIRKKSDARKAEKAAVKARIASFRSINTLCGINAKLSSNYLLNEVEELSLAELPLELQHAMPVALFSDPIMDPDGIPPEYYDTEFWSDMLRQELNWELFTSDLVYLLGLSDFARKCSVPLELCIAKCDMVGDSLLNDCLAIGALIGIAGYPAVGITVGAVCGTGAIIEKYQCKKECMQPCIP